MRAQTLMISFILLLAVIIVVIPFMINQFSVIDQKEYEEFEREAENTGNLLIDIPHPVGAPPEFWERAGIVDMEYVENELITTESLLNFASIDYSRSKLLLGVQNDYIFFFIKEGVPIEIVGPFNWQYFGWNGGGAPNGGSSYTEILGQIQNHSKFIARNEKFVLMEIENEIESVELIVYVFDAAGIGLLGGWIPEFYDFTGNIFTTQDVYTVGVQVNLTGDIFG